MKRKLFVLFVFLFCLFTSNAAFAEEIKYAFEKGAVYSYKYSRQEHSTVKASAITPQKVSDNQLIEFTIKSVGFQDKAFILDIGNKKTSFRRYVTTNGTLAGSPAEDPSELPFFPVFPNGDWRIGTASKQRAEILTFGQKVPVQWNLTLKNVDSIKSLAYIAFEAEFKIADSNLFSRQMNLKGEIIFNLAEGVIHKADWDSTYTAKLSCKEIAVSRELWDFEKKTNHSLVMTGVQK